MDREGFSGHDGRTTIFDYWTVGTLCRAAKKKLTEEEQSLALIYNKVLNIARKEKAVSEGLFYDLMYVNQRYHRQYMFLRKAKSSQLLVVANFDDLPATVDVFIPAHALQFLELREKEYSATDLLGGDTTKLTLKADQKVRVEVPANHALILKLK